METEHISQPIEESWLVPGPVVPGATVGGLRTARRPKDAAADQVGRDDPDGNGSVAVHALSPATQATSR